MKHLHFDLSAGAAGDMIVAALLDVGADSREFTRQLAVLPVGGYHLHIRRQSKSSIEGIKFDVHLQDCGTDHHHSTDHSHEHPHAHGQSHEHTHEHDAGGHRDFDSIRSLIRTSALSDWVKERAIAVFHRIAVAEGKIHGKPPEQVHFHEVGAVDSIVDIVGACIALDLLGRPHVTASRPVEGTGFVRCAHGRMPLPAPATLEILGAKGVPLSQCEEPHEMLTPTGAALLAEFVESFGPMQGVVGARVGYGLGTRDHTSRANVLRAVLWEDSAEHALRDWETDTVSVLESNIDDLSPEILGHVLEKALRLGALDAFHTPVQMKKNRPGVLLTLLCAETDVDSLTEFLLTETTAFGVRQTTAVRRKLRRRMTAVKTPFGEVQVKLGLLDGRIVQASPEFESCRSVAAMAGVPLRDVFNAAASAASSLR
jgi:uncharacterized protein (TIGR00299 family) protein